MKRTNHSLLFALFLLLLVFGVTSAFAQITPSQDSYTNTAKAATNYGAAVTLGVVSSNASIQTSYIQFDLSPIPAGYTSANVAKATLKLYANSVASAGSLNVDLVNGSWSEKTIAADLAPALGGPIASSVPVTTADANNYLLIDVTSAVGEWLNNAEPNDGLALVANSGLSATFDSKENTTQSHPAELDIVFNNDLPNSCSSGQILQWDGSAWVCAAEDTGSVTSVGLSAPGSDFIVSNSPVTSTGTLNFAWNVAPSPFAVSNAIVKRDSNGDFSASGIDVLSLDATTVITSGLTSSTSAPNSSLLFAQNTATSGSTTYAVYGESDSDDAGAAGVFGFVPIGSVNYAAGVRGMSGSAYGQGVSGYNENDSADPEYGGVGVSGVVTGDHAAGVYGVSVSGSGIPLNTGGRNLGAGVFGDTGVANNIGVAGLAADGYAALFENRSPSGYVTVLAAANNAASVPFFAENLATEQYCYVDALGNLNCSGAKHAVVPIDGGRRTVALSAIESPKNWFEDFGSAQLSGGVATVALEPEFAQTVNTGVEYHVFLTPNGDCKGLYVAQKTAGSFEVHELGGGASSVSFDYRIVALRKNFENIRLEDHTKEIAQAKILHAKKSPAQSASAANNVDQLIAHLKAVPKARPAAQKKVK